MKLIGIVVAGGVLVGLAAVAGLAAPLGGQTRDRDERMRRFELLRPIGGAGIGASVRDVDEADVRREQLPSPAGAAIDEVRSDGPAAKAGLRTGDVVVELDGERVRSARQFARLIRETPAGRTVKAVVMRAGRRVELDLVPEAGAGLMDRLGPAIRDLEEFGRSFDFSLPDFDLPDLGRGTGRRVARLGIGIAPLEPQLADYFGVRQGVLITSVAPGTPAARAGLKAGDVITSADGEAVPDTAALRRRLARSDVRDMSLGVVRDKKELAVKVTFDEPQGRRSGWPV
jgi:serine protease Do